MPARVTLISSTETVGAKFDKITCAEAVPAIEIEGVEGKFGEEIDFFMEEGPVGGENKVPLVEGVSRRWNRGFAFSNWKVSSHSFQGGLLETSPQE